MLDDRKAAILRVVVEEYIRTAQPVGSGHVATLPELAVSSATVRNEMGALERDGYLSQPHTSAGRVPTDKGYRFFVDSMTPGALNTVQANRVRSFFSDAHGELEKMLGDTSRLLSDLTRYAAVVTSPAHHDQSRVRSVQIVSLSERTALVVVVHSTGAVDKAVFDVDAEPTEVQLAAASAALSTRMVGLPTGEAPRSTPTGEAAVDDLITRATRALSVSDTADDQVFVGGAASMASAFDAVETIREVLSILEQQVVVVSLLRNMLDNGLSVAIGTEHGVQPLADCSVVVAPYAVEGEPAGAIGLLGPTRMRYDEALAAVAVVSSRLGKALTEGA